MQRSMAAEDDAVQPRSPFAPEERLLQGLDGSNVGRSAVPLDLPAGPATAPPAPLTPLTPLTPGR